MKIKLLLLVAVFSAIHLSAAPEHGAVCFTFDDYHGKN